MKPRKMLKLENGIRATRRCLLFHSRRLPVYSAGLGKYAGPIELARRGTARRGWDLIKTEGAVRDSEVKRQANSSAERGISDRGSF